MTKSRSLAAFLLSLSTIAGCSASPEAASSSEKATVKGVVTIQGKKATQGKVVFEPSGHEPVEAEIRSDGTYTLETWVGTNVVKLEGPALEKAAANHPPQVPQQVEKGENILDIAL